ncbi:MAG TPA: hypothetical protein ENJ89_02345, partial [Caldithrix abyssi]|nr:hypothetical protein [Caldithrix abyssi]
MKKLIIYFSVVITLLSLLIYASPLLLRVTGLERPFKKWALPKLLGDNFNEIELNRFSFGLGSLHLSDLKIRSKDRSIDFFMDQITFSYNIFDFFIHPGNPQRALKKITFESPVLILSDSDSLNETESESDSSSGLKKLYQRLQDIKKIDRIHITNATIIWKKKNGDGLIISRNAEGVIQPKADSLLTMRISGNFFSVDEKRLNATAVVDLVNRELRAEIRFDRYPIAHILNIFLPASTEFLDGKLDGKLIFRNRGFSLGKSVLNGELALNNLDFKYKNQIVHNTSGTVNINDNELIFKNGAGNYFDTPFEYRVECPDVLHPSFTGWFKFEKVNLSPAGSLLTSSFPDSCDAQDLILTFAYRPGAAEGSIVVSANTLDLYHKNTINNLRADILIRPENIRLSRLTGIVNGFRVNARADYQMAENALDILLQMRKKNGLHLVLDRLTEKKQTLNLALHINTRLHGIRGKWHYDLTAPGDTLLSFSGGIRGAGDQVRIKLTEAPLPDNQLDVRINHLWQKPVIEHLTVSHFPFQLLTSDDYLSKIFNRFTTTLNLKGSLGQLQGEIIIHDTKQKRADFRLGTTVLNSFSANRIAQGYIELGNLVGFYRFSLNQSGINGTVQFPSGITGRLNMDLAQNGRLDGTVTFNEFDLFQALADTVAFSGSNSQGFLNGTIRLYGNYKEPQLNVNLTADRLLINKRGYFQTALGMNLNKHRAVIDSLVLSLNNVPFTRTSGLIDWSDDSLSVDIDGNDIDIQEFSETFLRSQNWISGLIGFRSQMRGTLSNPMVYSQVVVQNGRLVKVPFERIEADIVDSIASFQEMFNPESHNWTIQRFDMFHNGQYRLTANGFLPFNKQDSLDLDFKFKGDFLSFLPLWLPFFRNATSNTLIDLSLGGTIGNLKVTRGFVQLDRGELWMQKVAPHIKNISGKITLRKGSNKVNFVNLRGEVDNEYFTINTVRNIETEDRGKLKPWYFRDLNLDFGVLALHTSGKGVNLNIPGLMAPEDFGNLYLAGKREGESFYFAGPPKHPVVYGEVDISDTRLTYPFIEQIQPGAKTPIVVEFLMNIDWDVLVRSKENVVYYRDIPAFIDNVHTEFFIDESSPGLSFNGILNQKTFKPLGKLSSSRGRLEYLDQTFRVDYFEIEFNKWDIYPVVSGRAWTTVRDSLGAPPKTIYLKLYAKDKETGAEKQQGRWEDFRFKLESADPQIGESQEQVLAYMGFSVNNLKDKATSVGGAVTERYIFRPLLRPLERVLERSLGVDMVRINSNIARNLFYSSMGLGSNQAVFFNPFSTHSSYLFLMQSSEFTIGKYLTQNLYLTYTGQLVSVLNKNQPELDFNHSIGLEYRFLRNVLLEFEFDRQLMGYYQ